jgi:hypothetical protein
MTPEFLLIPQDKRVSNMANNSHHLIPGLGGPIYCQDTTNDLDPTLDVCCQRDALQQQKADSLRQTLRKYDRVAAAEETHKQTLNQSGPRGIQHVACLCRNDLSSDPLPPYRALALLRQQLATERKDKGEAHDFNEMDRDQEVSSRNNSIAEEDHFWRNQHDDEKKNDSHSDDDDLDEYDYLLDEDLLGEVTLNPAEKWQDLRRAELEQQLNNFYLSQYHGYGVYRAYSPQQVLVEAGLSSTVSPNLDDLPPPPMVILHLYDVDSVASAVLDMYLEDEFVPKYSSSLLRSTKVLRSEGRPTVLQDARGLVSRHFSGSQMIQVDTDLPALVAIRQGQVVAVCKRLQGLVTNQQIIENAVYTWLDHAGVLRDTPPPPIEKMCRRLPPEQAAMLASMAALSARDEKQFFDCGVAGCHKPFQHEHVGISNHQQTGHSIVSVEEILGAAPTNDGTPEN